MLDKELPDTIVQDYSHQHYQEVDDKDFEIRPLRQMRLIETLPERDDQCIFEQDMYNFGDQEDLPDSDRAMDKSCKNN